MQHCAQYFANLALATVTLLHLLNNACCTSIYHRATVDFYGPHQYSYLSTPFLCCPFSVMPGKMVFLIMYRNVQIYIILLGYVCVCVCVCVVFELLVSDHYHKTDLVCPSRRSEWLSE